MIKNNRNRFIPLVILFLFSLLFTEKLQASDEGEDFNATEMIMHHISDSHEFHILGEGESSVSVPLPIILYTKNGLDIFMSSKFHHGEETVTTDKGSYELIHDKIYYAGTYSEEEHTGEQPLDFSITKNVFTLILSSLLICLIFISTARAYKKRPGAPKGLQSFMEPLIIFVRDEIAIPNIGKNYYKFMPYLLTVFFFIWLSNLIGLVPFFPGSSNLSGNVSFTATLAVITLLVTTFSGNKAYWKHIFWMPGVPVPVKILLAPIELISVFAKPFALAVRLFANITAGHIVILSLIGLIFILGSVAASAVAVPLALFISVLELLVAFLQAFVFTLLSALFIGQAVAEPEHH
ncbi:F0F1 ATP synthase subunit A [Marivirga sp. S37H4]|uniref:ATP synthase subunit a n=1 Tax=Marivirga aurantiaca TaxID=2802615 RepID=A0A935C8W8_9BACT|nr:F0F1 ATP synthase subunit A [Marivirga aurantiaca]MBK6265841.1 F0F1 ATP synthase subunit A [Marivirga aurantiaca]